MLDVIDYLVTPFAKLNFLSFVLSSSYRQRCQSEFGRRKIVFIAIAQIVLLLLFAAIGAVILAIATG
jgi:hypothetical protein